MANEITVTIKLFSGIDKEVPVLNYDMAAGIVVTARKGTRLRRVLMSRGMKKPSQYIYFIDGKRVSPWKSMREDCEVSCLKPSAGG